MKLPIHLKEINFEFAAINTYLNFDINGKYETIVLEQNTIIS